MNEINFASLGTIGAAAGATAADSLDQVITALAVVVAGIATEAIRKWWKRRKGGR